MRINALMILFRYNSSVTKHRRFWQEHKSNSELAKKLAGYQAKVTVKAIRKALDNR